MTMRTRHFVLSSALLCLFTAGCGDISSPPGDRDVDAGSAPRPTPTHTVTPGAPMPTSVPGAAGLVASRGPVTILDDGDGPELCLGGVATSLPPQCGGPSVVGWTWADHRGDFEEASGVQWGEFAVTGTFDGTDFTMTRAVPGDEYDAPPGQADGADFSTPCPEPAGGWRVLDPAKTTNETMEATFEAARHLPRYADAWLDQTRNPAYGQEEGAEERMNDPAYVTINVRVTRDVEGAEAELREIWGGALCVTQADHTEKELRGIQEELNDLPGMLSSWSSDDRVEVEVVHDDGSIQAWADATYGAGLVRISSALVPASD